MDQKSPIVEEGQPVIVRDLREEKRAAAAAARAAKEAEPVVVTPEDVAATAQDESDDVLLVAAPDTAELSVNRQARLEELYAKARADTELTDDEKVEMLRLQGEEQDAAKEAEANAPLAVRTAFLVIIGHDGTATATSDCNQSIEIDREASIDDMYAGAAIVLRDIDASIAAKHVVFGLNVSAQAMQEKQMAVRAMQQLQQPGGRPGRRH